MNVARKETPTVTQDREIGKEILLISQLYYLSCLAASSLGILILNSVSQCTPAISNEVPNAKSGLQRLLARKKTNSTFPSKSMSF